METSERFLTLLMTPKVPGYFLSGENLETLRTLSSRELSDFVPSVGCGTLPANGQVCQNHRKPLPARVRVTIQ